jgi:hypothetical protein
MESRHTEDSAEAFIQDGIIYVKDATKAKHTILRGYEHGKYSMRIHAKCSQSINLI